MQNNFNSIKKTDNINLSIYLIPFLIIIPKINLISVSGFWQGIRLEDIVTLFMLLYMVLNSKKYSLRLYDPSIKFYFFVSFALFSYVVGHISGISYGNADFVQIARMIEYCVIVLFFSNINFDRENIKKIISVLKFLIIVNFIISVGQYYEIIGYYSSRGYHAPDYEYWKAFGIFSGSWELSFITSISYFIIFLETKKKLNIYLILTLIILFLAGTRGIQFPFILTILIMYFKNILQIQTKFKLFIYLIIFSLSCYFMYSYHNINLLFLINTLIDLFLYQHVPDFSDLTSSEVVYYSWIHRLKDFLIFYQLMSTNLFTFLFGTGFTAIYYESFIFRILCGTGIMGFFLLIIFCFRLNIFIIIFLIITGITLDFVSSFKQFLILYFFFQYMRFYNKNDTSY
tara:strand:+ start:1896 stop:3095 length:1200 start_codon:yes stop_codon:yes gene_type:complete